MDTSPAGLTGYTRNFVLKQSMSVYVCIITKQALILYIYARTLRVLCEFMIHEILDMHLALAKQKNLAVLFQQCPKLIFHCRMLLNKIHTLRCGGSDIVMGIFMTSEQHGNKLFHQVFIQSAVYKKKEVRKKF